MKTKEQVIKEAYGTHFEALKDVICMHSGFCQNRRYNKIVCLTPSRIGFKEEYDSEWVREDDGERMVDVFRWRPKSLRGFEDNNGWIKLTGAPYECEVPSEPHVLAFYNSETKETYISYDPTEYIKIGRFTHYKVIQVYLDKLPLY